MVNTKKRLEIGPEFAKKTFNGILIPHHPQLPIIIMFLSLCTKKNLCDFSLERIQFALFHESFDCFFMTLT